MCLIPAARFDCLHKSYLTDRHMPSTLLEGVPGRPQGRGETESKRGEHLIKNVSREEMGGKELCGG